MGRGNFFQAYRYIFGGRAFVSSGDAWRAYSIRPYPTGRRCLLFIPKTFTTHPGFFVVHLSFLDVPCRGVSHTPHKRPGRGGCRMMGRGNFFRRDNTSFVEACLPPAGALGGRIRYAPTLPAGDVSYLYPQRLPRTPPLSFSDAPFSMSL